MLLDQLNEVQSLRASCGNCSGKKHPSMIKLLNIVLAPRLLHIEYDDLVPQIRCHIWLRSYSACIDMPKQCNGTAWTTQSRISKATVHIYLDKLDAPQSSVVKREMHLVFNESSNVNFVYILRPHQPNHEDLISN